MQRDCAPSGAPRFGRVLHCLRRHPPDLVAAPRRCLLPRGLRREQADLCSLLGCFGQVEKIKMFSGQVRAPLRPCSRRCPVMCCTRRGVTLSCVRNPHSMMLPVVLFLQLARLQKKFKIGENMCWRCILFGGVLAFVPCPLCAWGGVGEQAGGARGEP